MYAFFLGVEVYRVDRSPLMGKIRSPWAIKRISKRSAKTDQGETFTERLTEEATILR